MSSRLFVGSLSWDTTEEQLKEAFEAVVPVESVNVIRDRATNRSKGFGFVDVASEEDANKAIEALNGAEVDGRKLTVNIARPMKDR
ncbi:MAG TPA: RNA-binding protein [Candidatus Dormibacteraeota bacterium]|nr:RNA-binding protein [Candidatus Dormibacteraeota bacterium]